MFWCETKEQKHEQTLNSERKPSSSELKEMSGARGAAMNRRRSLVRVYRKPAEFGRKVTRYTQATLCFTLSGSVFSIISNKNITKHGERVVKLAKT